jgi:hypothetical protein
MTISSGQGTRTITVSWTATAAGNGIMGNVTVQANNACGTGNTSALAIDYNYTKPVTPGSISGAGKVCPGGTATYSISGVARATTYSWTVPTGMTITSGAGTNVIVVSVGGGYTGGTLSVTAGNVCGTSSARTKALGANMPLAPTVITASQIAGLCNVSGVAFSATSTHATSYTWTVPAGATIASGSGTGSITVNFTTTGGSVTVAGVNTCGTGSARSLTVTTAPARPSNISGPTTVCTGTTESYTAQNTTGAASYTWTVPSGAVITGSANSKDVAVTFPGITATGQIITAKGTNACGTGPSRSLQNITIQNCPAGRDAIEVTNMKATVFPNPVSDRATLYIESQVEGETTVQLLDFSGRVLLRQALQVQPGVTTFEFSLSNYSSGIYFLNLLTTDGEQSIRMIKSE